MFGRNKQPVVSTMEKLPADDATSVFASEREPRSLDLFPLNYAVLVANNPGERVVATVRFDGLAYDAGPERSYANRYEHHTEEFNTPDELKVWQKSYVGRYARIRTMSAAVEN